jgi:serine/threonine-protein kinase
VSEDKPRLPSLDTRIITGPEPMATVVERHARLARSGDSTADRTSLDPAEVDPLLQALRAPAVERHAFESKIAEGGMGSIAIVRDRALARRVAKKSIHPTLLVDDNLVRMFLREARVNAALDHPHIVPVYDVGEDPNGCLFFTMKLVQGQPLKHIIKGLPPGKIETGVLFNLLEVVIKVCDALAFAHSKGILHCDVKPDNVMVGDFGQVYLMDWGIARAMEHEEAPRPSKPPRAGRPASATDESVIGTVAYMSPEQAQGNRALLDPRADVFLLGGLLYEILARRPPYMADGFEATLKAAIACDVPPLRSVCKEGSVPSELERIVGKAMARQRSQRHAGPSELKDDLVRFMRGGTEFPQTTFPKGSYVVKEGDPGDSAYIIVSGRCEVLKIIDGTVSVMQKLGPGQVFGEMAILTDSPRTATVLATEETTVLVVTKDVFEQELEAMKPWMRSVLQMVASRFRDLYTSRRVTHVGAPNPVRVARQIYMHVTSFGAPAPDGSIAMPWTKLCAEIEAQLGVPIAMGILAVTKSFPAIQVDYTRDRLTVTDPAALRAML